MIEETQSAKQNRHAEIAGELLFLGSASTFNIPNGRPRLIALLLLFLFFVLRITQEQRYVTKEQKNWGKAMSGFLMDPLRILFAPKHIFSDLRNNIFTTPLYWLGIISFFTVCFYSCNNWNNEQNLEDTNKPLQVIAEEK